MERPLTEHFRPDGAPLSLREYEQAGGYQALRKALKEIAPPQLTLMVKEANLRGRGGAGFNAGMKWSFVPMGPDAARPKYVVVNADEMEPGTFKDRILVEGNPHQLIEGILLCAWAVQADIAYIFLREEYQESARRLKIAIAEGYERHYLGENIMGMGFNVELMLHTSAGRYICGEETALLNSLEGKRAIPRSKPPFPPVVGLWGKPTVVNNVETFCNIPHIVNKGVAWYKGLSRTTNGGTKIYGASGRVKKPGWWELPMGTTFREIIEEYAGGMRDGYKLRAIIPGGASTEFLMPEHLDVQGDFDAVEKVGSRLGTGTMIVLDDKTCPVGMVLNMQHFFAQESCGWCTPCREGLPWIEKILHAIENGKGQPGDLGLLRVHTRFLGMGMTFCALAPGAMEPLASALKYFKEDFDRHIAEKKCPFRS